MRRSPINVVCVVMLAASAFLNPSADARPAQTAAFTYQGVLKNSGTPVNGSVDLQFRLFDAAVAGAPIGSTLALNAVSVTNGLFSASLDFGALAFDGNERWLEIAVASPASGGVGPFTTLTPRQQLANTPYAAFALNTALSGTYANALALTNAANQFTGSFTGSGSALTNLNPANLAAGTAGINITGNAANVSGIVAIANGGTGATNAATARSNLGAAAATHTHAAADVASGNLAIARLPTGGGWSLSTNLNIDANTFVIDQLNNRVGIGEASPRNALDVEGGVAIGSPFSGLANPAPTNGLAVVGDVGIGTIVPDDRLHVYSGDSGASASSGARVIIEDDVDHYINLLAPDTEEIGVLFGNPTNGAAAGGVIFNSPNLVNGLQFRANTNDTFMAITNAGDVGVGTTAPAARLHVVGDARIDGSITIPAAARTFTVGPADFDNGTAVASANSYSLATSPFRIVGSGASVQVILFAPVHLPHNATVTGLHLHAIDNGLAENMFVDFNRQSLTTTTSSQLASTLTSSTGSGIRLFSDTSITNAVIDNTAYTYFLSMGFSVPTNPADMAFIGARIEYTITQPLP